MNTTIDNKTAIAPQTSKSALWTGRILSTLAVLFLLMDGVMKLFKPVFVTDAMTKLGYPPSETVPIGIAILVCTILYVIPRTSIFGAVLLTGFLGGAVATNFRVQSPLFSNELFPVYVAAMVWGGLLLRDAKLRDIFPFRK